MKRRELLLAGGVPLLSGQASKQLILPSDTPDELGFRAMWYSPTMPVDMKTWGLEVKGLVEKPQRFEMAQLRVFPQVSQSSRLKCIQCWSARTTWGGFRFASLLDVVKPTAAAKAIRIDCADKWYEHMTLEDMAKPQVLLTLDRGGKLLPPRNGGPLRLLDPSRYGYKSAKLITSITFVEEAKGSMACDIAPYYTPMGEIQAGYDTPLDLMPEAAGGRLDPKLRRRIKGGEITEY